MNANDLTLQPGPDEQTGASMRKVFQVSAGPFIRGKATVRGIMLITFGALLPATGIAITLFGLRELYAILLSITAAVAGEWLFSTVQRKKIEAPDLSAALTGLLLALSLPSGLPLWIAPLGSLFAVIIVKALFGGTGRNFLNPALAGRAFLALAFPGILGAAQTAIAGQLPLSMGEIPQFLFNHLVGYQCIWIGGASVGALLIGAIVLWSFRIIDYTLPLSFILCAYIFYWIGNDTGSYFTAIAALVPLMNLLTGGIFLAAFFMATDPVTSPASRLARLIFGAGCSAATVAIEMIGIPGSGPVFAVLLMNLTVPYLDRLLRLKPFGNGTAAEVSDSLHDMVSPAPRPDADPSLGTKPS